MYKKIVVPLDGSKLAECILPHVVDLAKGTGTEEIILVSVTERVSGKTPIGEYTQTKPSPIMAPQPMIMYESVATGDAVVLELPSNISVATGKMLSQAQRYLDRVAGQLDKEVRQNRINVRLTVLLGNPAEEIVHFAEQEGADLILIASHGRSGISRWTHGSVAERVFRGSKVPVLVVKAPGAVAGN